MQDALFDTGDLPRRVAPADAGERVHELAARLRRRFGDRLHLGTSSWHFPGWAGVVWDRPHEEATLSRHGLAAYAAHPLLRCVSLDRAFYRPLDAPAYAALAAQVPADFRFIVKAFSGVTDAVQRDPANGRALQPNPRFLDVDAALATCVQPAAQGLRDRLGVLVFQLSPLPAAALAEPMALQARLEALWQAARPALPDGAQLALELRDPALLTPALARSLKAHGVRFCVGVHDRMPDADAQLPMLRATWPGDLVCRWNLQRGQRYAEAKDAWAPFDRLRAPDPATRATLARVAAATLGAGHRVFIAINNKAEGSAPHSVIAFAEALLAEG